NNLVVLRLSSNSALSSNAASAFLDEYTTDGSLVQSVVLSSTFSGTATSEGGLCLSPDGKSISTAGYKATAGTSGISSSSTVPRVGIIVNYDGTVDETTTFTGKFASNNIRGSIVSGSDIWGYGATSGLEYSSIGGSSPVGPVNSEGIVNLRYGCIFDSNLYVSRQKGSGGSTPGIYSIIGTPKTASSAVLTLQLSTALNVNGFVKIGTSIYVCVMSTDSSGTNGVYRYDLTNNLWSLKTSLSITGAAHITGYSNGTYNLLYVTNQSTIVKIEDSITNPSMISSIIVTATTNS
ncbi:hypothetical protein HK096_006405, partial [Nowakowskiella sp. JEL0078]